MGCDGSLSIGGVGDLAGWSTRVGGGHLGCVGDLVGLIFACAVAFGGGLVGDIVGLIFAFAFDFGGGLVGDLSGLIGRFGYFLKENLDNNKINYLNYFLFLFLANRKYKQINNMLFYNETVRPKMPYSALFTLSGQFTSGIAIAFFTKIK